MARIIICPYYLEEEYPSIYCEMAKITFPNMDSREEYVKERCASFGYHDCPFAHILDVKYGVVQPKKRGKKQ